VKWFTISQASKYIKISTHTLNEWREKNKGPVFVKMGNQIKYSKEALDRYLNKGREPR
jgi:excisionase family DNA binding protein